MQVFGKHLTLQAYRSLLTDEFLALGIAKINSAFPSLTEGFYKILSDRLKVKKVTNEEFSDAVDHVIDTCEYPNPQVANFMIYIDKNRIPPEERPEEIQPVTTDQEKIYEEKDRKFFKMLEHMDDDLTEEEKEKNKRFGF